MKLTSVVVGSLLGVLFSVGVASVCAQETGSPVMTSIPENATEVALVERIKQFRGLTTAARGDAAQRARVFVAQQELVVAVDALLQHYPKTPFKDEALQAKLVVLADLARTHPTYLDELLRLTAEIASAKATEPLASEGSFFGIQAFVLGARREGMPERQRLSGTAERYTAFLDDFAKSARVPIVRASLIRNLIALKQVDRARGEFALLERDHPDHRATHRARGELYRVVAIDQPFSYVLPMPDGKSIRTRDYLGKVLVIHFWAMRGEGTTEELSELVGLHDEFRARGLQLIGVNLDRDVTTAKKTIDSLKVSWPQQIEGKGLRNDMAVATGVLRVPTYLIVDRKGVLRAIDNGDRLRELVERLIAER